MEGWNAVVNVRTAGYRRAFEALEEFGPVSKTDFYNVLAMEARDVPVMLDTLRERFLNDPAYLDFLSRLIPVTRTFLFQSPEEFEEKAGEAALGWAPELAGKGFHVRMHRRGFKGRLSGLEEERFLDDALLEALRRAGTPGRVTFEDPDAVIAVETIAQWAGMSLWSRQELKQYPFVRVD
jgi:tRNA(Ser,Leu) C12 N-acetylase TAN1